MRVMVIRKKKKERNQRKKELNERLIKGRIIRDIGTLFEKEEGEDYYKPKRVSNFWNNNYIKYESNGDKKKKERKKLEKKRAQ